MLSFLRRRFVYAYTALGLLIIGLSSTGAAAPIGTGPSGVIIPARDPQAALDWQLARQRDENGQIPADGKAIAIEHVKNMPKAGPKGGAGPKNAGVYPGGWTWLGPGNIGGRIRALVIHPTNPNIMWVGTAAGGIWKTINGGTSWTPLDDFLPNLAVSSLVIDPNDPNTLYAGTGEGFFNGDAIQGAGIFKSINGGTNWTQLAQTAPSVSSNYLYVNRLAIASTGASSTNLLAATRLGIFRSTDGGATWTQPLNSAAVSVMDVNFNPQDPTKAVAGGNTGKAWYSIDIGATWTAANTSGINTNSKVRLELAYARSQPSIVYASVNQDKNGFRQYNGEIWRSNDGGASYTLVNTGDVFLETQGQYSNALWVDPTDPNKLIVGGPNLWRGVYSGGTVILSLISQGFNGSATPQYFQHALVEQPGYNGTTNRTVFFTNDGGIYKAADVSTVTPTSGWQELNNTLGITQFYGGAGHPTNGLIIGGSQGSGGLRFDGDPQNWSRLSGSGTVGDNGYVAVDPTDPNYLYGENVQMAIYRSANGGATSDYIFTGLTDALSGNVNYIAPITLDPNNPTTMLAGGRDLWRTTNLKAGLPTWTSIKGSIGTNISAVTVAPGNSNIIWLGHNGGQLYRTANGQAASPSWTTVDDNSATNPLPNRMINNLTLDPANSNNVYVGLSGYSAGNLWRTTNGGGAWTNASGAGATALPNVPVYAVAVHPTQANWLYAGTDLGIFTSEDGGVTWKTGPNDGPANVPVYQLFWTNTTTLVAVTHGRGMYKSDIPGNVPSLKTASLAISDSLGNSNGAADPGEVITLQITLRNDGPQVATAISSTVVITAGNASLTNPNSPYPNLTAYGGSAANSQSYSLTINPSAVCGEKIYLRQTVSYNGSQTYTYDFSIVVGASQLGAAVNYTYSGGAIPIPDGNAAGVEVPLSINAPGQIGDINLSLNISHTWDADLRLILVAPNGQTVLLVNKRGSGGSNFTGTVLDDEAATEVGSRFAPFTGSYRPEQPLSNLDGLPISGTWKLRIFDDVSGDSGQLLGFSLTIQPATYSCNLVNSNPAPSITRLLPASTKAAGPGFTLTVYGTGFMPASVVGWNGNPQTTSFLNSTQLSIEVPAGLVTSAGTVPITVFTNAPPGGGTSNAQTFTITAGCDPLVVTKTSDDGSCGTLRAALAVFTPNPEITFAFSLPNTITITTGALTAPLPNGMKVTAPCLGGGPSLTINGNATPGDGLTLSIGNWLQGLRVRNFGGSQVKTGPGGGGNNLKCVSFSKT